MYDLDFVEICIEEYDFLIDENAFESEKMKRLLEVFRSAEFRKRLSEMGGYSCE